ncbi:MAG TPA: MFS transporter [Streptosporangiaceae bacterium]|jgi:CP family cyanate transporter-like MFS transporter
MPDPAAPPAPSPPRTRRYARNGVLLVAGVIAIAFNLRAAITSLPPLFPELAARLHLTPVGVSVLASLPVLAFGVFSGVAAPLSRRFGEEQVLGAAVGLLAAGLILRGAAPGVLLFPGTALAAAAIALLNVLLPSLVKRRAPERAGLLIGLYLLSLNAGSILAALIAIPVYNLSGGSVPLSLSMWALPALAAGVAWLPQRRYRTVPHDRAPLSRATAPDSRATQPPPGRPAAPARPLKLSRSALTWQVTAFMGLQSLTFYAELSWLPTMFRDRGVSAGGAGTLLALMNLGGAASSLLIPVLAHRARNQRALIAATVAASAAGLAGAWFAPVGGAAVWVLVLGLGQGASLGLAIFFTMARAPNPRVAASLSGFAQSAGYLVATTGPLAIGFLHSALGGWTIPVAVLLVITGLQLAAGWQAARAVTLPVAG